MATLTAAISSSVTEFSVSGDVSAARTAQEYRIDDEVIVLREFVRTKAERRGPRNRNRWSVSRGQAGTTAASHLIAAEIFALNGAVATGVSLAEPEPFAGTGTGGGVTVDNQSDPPAEVTTIVAANADVSVPGQATLLPEVNISHTTTGADDAGVEISALAENGSANVTVEVYSNVSPSTIQLSAGSGADVAQINLVADDGATSPSYMTLDAAKMGFYDVVVPVAQPAPIADATDPASTMARLNDVLTALRALGLIDT